MTQAEELNLELELIFDNSPIDILGSGRIQKKDLIFHLQSGALLGQPIEQPMTTNTSKHSPTEYNVRCGVIISSKRYACSAPILDVPENSCVPLLTVTPAPPVFY